MYQCLYINGLWRFVIGIIRKFDLKTKDINILLPTDMATTCFDDVYTAARTQLDLNHARRNAKTKLVNEGLANAVRRMYIDITSIDKAHIEKLILEASSRNESRVDIWGGSGFVGEDYTAVDETDNSMTCNVKPFRVAFIFRGPLGGSRGKLKRLVGEDYYAKYNIPFLQDMLREYYKPFYVYCNYDAHSDIATVTLAWGKKTTKPHALIETPVVLTPHGLTPVDPDSVLFGHAV